MRKKITVLWLSSMILGLILSLSACAQDTLIRLPTTTDEFTQNTAAAVDVLWVVDNSQSMAAEQAGLGESFTHFVSELVASDIDYRIGVVSTDPADGGRLHDDGSGTAWVDATMDGAVSIETFKSLVRVGTAGALVEKAFETTAMALGKGPGWVPGTPATSPNGDFLRDDAALFIIMVSDEDDNSFGPVNYYRRLFESHKGPGNEARISVSAIVSPAGESPCYSSSRGGASQAGDRYTDLASQTGGIVTSICDNFNEALAELSLTAAGLKAVFPLEELANENARMSCPGAFPDDAFCVSVNGEALPRGDRREGWIYESSSNSIVFGVSDIPPPQARITITYQAAR